MLLRALLQGFRESHLLFPFEISPLTQKTVAFLALLKAGGGKKWRNLENLNKFNLTVQKKIKAQGGKKTWKSYGGGLGGADSRYLNVWGWQRCPWHFFSNAAHEILEILLFKPKRCFSLESPPSPALAVACDAGFSSSVEGRSGRTSGGSDVPAQRAVGTQSPVLEYGFGTEHEQPALQPSSSSKGHAVISGTV